MKNRFLIILAVILLLSPCIILSTSGKENFQREEEEPGTIEETVTVTNVEVPVRVLFEGKPVKDLTKSDFALYEDKKRMKINGFFPKRKKLKIDNNGIVSDVKGQESPRTFVLAFRTTEFNKHLEQAVQHLFDNILRKNDRIMIFSNEKSREYTNLQDKEAAKQDLLEVLKSESHRAKQELIVYINKVETLIDFGTFDKTLTHGYKLSVRIHNFLKEYSRTWNEYKKKYLIPRIDRFYYLARYLENIKGEKWVLNFYQFDLFPNIRLSNKFSAYLRNLFVRFHQSKDYGDQAIAKICETLLDRISIEMSVSKGFPIEEVSKLFYKANATFHSFFLRTMNKGNVNEIDYIEVSSDVEQTLKRITYFTGGKNITSNNLVQSLDTISEAEDAYYILSYVPRNPDKAGKIKIKVKEPKDKQDQYQVLYDDNFNADYINDYFNSIEKNIEAPGLKVVDFSFKGKILAFRVQNYSMRNTEKAPVGKLKIRISVIDKSNNSPLFDQEKVLTAQKGELKISIGAFKKIKKGEYNFIINAEDMFTSKTDNFHRSIRVK